MMVEPFNHCNFNESKQKKEKKKRETKRALLILRNKKQKFLKIYFPFSFFAKNNL